LLSLVKNAGKGKAATVIDCEQNPILGFLRLCELFSKEWGLFEQNSLAVHCRPA
jgi:hypothetical protein